MRASKESVGHPPGASSHSRISDHRQRLPISPGDPADTIVLAIFLLIFLSVCLLTVVKFVLGLCS